jgi:hypothetical protein
MTISNKITPLPPLHSKIKQAINDKKLAIFIGAGVSRLIGCDGWDTLAKNLVKKCTEENLINPITKELLLKQTDKIKIISICDNILKEKSFMQVMKKSLKDDEIVNLVQSDKFQIYRDLKNMSNTFITTNADRFIDSLFDVSNIHINKFSAEKVSDSKHKLYKIHGCIGNMESLVFTKNQYMSTYTNSYFIEFIKTIFDEYTVLFVGYGLNEFELLSKIFPQFDTDKNPKHFLLNPYFQHEQEIYNLERDYFKKIGIRLIPFSRNEKDYNQLIDVINEWHNVAIVKTRKMQNNFIDIVNALENPS